MLRTSRSPIFGEALDFVTAIFDKDLRLVAQRDYIPVLAGAIPPAMKEIARAYEEDINEDDIFIHLLRDSSPLNANLIHTKI